MNNCDKYVNDRVYDNDESQVKEDLEVLQEVK